MQRTYREILKFAQLMVLALCMTLVTSQKGYKVDVRADASKIMTESDVTTPFRLQGDGNKHPGKMHFRTRSHDRSLEHEDAEFKNPIYEISAFGQNLVFELEQDQDLISPAYTTTFSWSNETANQKPRKGSRVHGCFYKGKVNGEPSSQVTVSICDGMTGAIRTEEYEYFITPMRAEDEEEKVKGEDTGSGKPHSIHRRSIRSKKRKRDARAPSCGVNERRHRRTYTQTFMGNVDNIARQIRNKREVINSAQKTFEKEETLSRTKREFESNNYYIETMVVADRTMSDHHGDDLEHYILTIMMVANRVFAHPSLGNSVTLSVVKIMQSGDDLHVSSNAATALRDFCVWQSKHNTPDDTDPNHYDLAILLTRTDLCGDTCDTLGMAEVGAMCSTKHSCAVVEDDGLSASYTVSHEIGHVLNMMHDDNRLCRSNFVNINRDTHIMSSTMNKIDNDQPWSLCSKEAITDFLESGRGSCMLDRPRDAKVYPNRLPGEMYSVNSQCEMSFGIGAIECPFMQECGRLWCHTPGGKHQCHTRHFPRADGSPCGRGLHCFQGKCVKATQMRAPKDGQWGAWGEFGTCSRTCGSGVKMSSRECNNPAPENGGKYCIGTRMRFRSCNTDACPTDASGSPGLDFRSEQCARYNNHLFPHLGVKTLSQWLPKYSNVFGNDRCRLNCQSVQTGALVTLASKVIDGTRCDPNTTDICVQGICMQAGCDGVLGSKTKFDKCGVCGGGNRHCKRVKGAYKKKLYGYNDVVMIPEGAASVEIVQRGYRNKVHDGNYLAIKDWKGEYLLNGGLTLSTFQKEFTINGTIFQYTGVGAATEKIKITGKLRGSIYIQVLSLGVGAKGRILPPRIKYIYYKTQIRGRRPKRPSTSAKRNRVAAKPRKTQVKTTPTSTKPSTWVTGRWSICKPTNGKCGSGSRTRRVTCRSDRRISTSGCESRVKPYNTLPCVVKCDADTDKKLTTRVRSGNTPVGGITRTRGRSPSAPVLVSRYNNKKIGQPVWIEGRWGPCDRSCGKGVKYRNVICRAQGGQLLGDSQCSGEKPSTQHGCMLKEC